MTKKEKEAQERKKQLAKRDEMNIEISEATKKMVLKEREKLPKLLYQRKEELIEKLENAHLANRNNVDDETSFFENKYPYQEVIDNMFKPILKWREHPADYSPAQLWEIFDIFTDMCLEIKKKEKSFTPTLDLFLMFSDIGGDTFKRLQSNPAYRPTCDRIYSFIGAKMSENSMNKLIDNRTATFLEERELGKQLAPNVTVIGSQFNQTISNDILDKFKQDLLEKQKY